MKDDQAILQPLMVVTLLIVPDAVEDLLGIMSSRITGSARLPERRREHDFVHAGQGLEKRTDTVNRHLRRAPAYPRYRRPIRHSSPIEGSCAVRTNQTGPGDVELPRPRIDDRRVNDAAHRIRFTRKILPPYLRRTKSAEELIGWPYLKGNSTGDFFDATGDHTCTRTRGVLFELGTSVTA